MSDRASRADGTDRDCCEICGVEVGRKGLCTFRCPTHPNHSPGLIGGRGNAYGRMAAVYQKAVLDVRDRDLTPQKAVSSAAKYYGYTLPKGIRADLEWVVEVEAPKFENENHSLSFLHDYFDEETLRSLYAGGER